MSRESPYDSESKSGKVRCEPVARVAWKVESTVLMSARNKEFKGEKEKNSQSNKELCTNLFCRLL